MTDKEVERAFTMLANILQTNPKKAESFLRTLKAEYYGETFGGVKSPEELTRIRVLFESRLDNNHKCCHCGACCDRVLMLTKREKTGILRYLKKNPSVKKYIKRINEGHPHRKCPFLDHTKGSEKCMIYGYDFLPFNCKSYLCDETSINSNDVLMFYMKEGLPQSVDLWHLFGDPVDITTSWQLKDNLSLQYGIRLGPTIMLYPEKLNENLAKYLDEIIRSIH